MIGNKTLATIKVELVEHYSKKFKDPIRHFREEIRRAERNKTANRIQIETLQIILQTLEEGAKKSKKPTRKTPRKKAISIS